LTLSVFLPSFLQSTTTRRASGLIFEKTDFDNTVEQIPVYQHICICIPLINGRG